MASPPLLPVELLPVELLPVELLVEVLPVDVLPVDDVEEPPPVPPGETQAPSTQMRSPLHSVSTRHAPDPPLEQAAMVPASPAQPSAARPIETAIVSGDLLRVCIQRRLVTSTSPSDLPRFEALDAGMLARRSLAAMV